jgi:hypothetical protein
MKIKFAAEPLKMLVLLMLLLLLFEVVTELKKFTRLEDTCSVSGELAVV